MSLSGAITIVLLVLKLLKLITISWGVVFAPVVIVTLLEIIIYVITVLLLKK